MNAGTLRVRPVLFCAAVFWEAAYWSETTHAWDWVEAETPLEAKPWAEIEISLDVTLGEVIEAACDGWSIEAGPDMLKHGVTRSQQFVRFAFVRPDRDVTGVDRQAGHCWPSTLPVARGDGSIEQIPGFGIPYRDLLASASLGLIEGDVKRPYVHPVIPQGDPATIAEFGRLAAAAVRAAYDGVQDSVGYADHTLRLIRASLPELHRVADETVDEGTRVVAVLAFFNWLRTTLRRHR